MFSYFYLKQKLRKNGEKYSSLQKELIFEAIKSNEWALKTDYDGCTGVSDLNHLGFPFDCLVHDFHWITGRGGALSDKIFYDLMIARGVPKWRARKRYLGVRLGWFGFYKWKHLTKGNKRENTFFMEKFKNKKK